MDKDKNNSEEEIQDVTAEPGTIISQAKVTNIFQSLHNDQKPPVKIQTDFNYEDSNFSMVNSASFVAMRASKESNEAKVVPYAQNLHSHNISRVRINSNLSKVPLQPHNFTPNAISLKTLYTESIQQQRFIGRDHATEQKEYIDDESIQKIWTSNRPQSGRRGVNLLNEQSVSYPELHNNATETDMSALLAANPSNIELTVPNQRGILLQQHTQEHQQRENMALKYWREDYDESYMYEMDKRTEFQGTRAPNMRELQRWYDADIKEHRRAFYIKQAVRQNDRVLTVAELDRLELLKNREDRWPLSNFRKSVRKISIHINIFAMAIIKRRAFEACTIAVIMINCITLTMSKAGQEPTPTENLIENIFQALYTVEMVLKILGLGFIFNKGAYLRDYFNILDFFIVMSAYLSMVQSSSGDDEGGLSLSSLRAFRVLRPLRAVNNIPGLRLIVQSILSALPLLKDTIIVLMFFFLIFAIGGVNMFQGMLRQRCIEIETGVVMLDDDGVEVICGDEALCGEGQFCGKRILNPNYDVTSFDNIFWALLAIFQCVTLEGWSDIMVLYQKVYTYYVFLFFVPLVFIGAFFLLNLTLAVINTSFNDAQELQNKVKAEKEAELNTILQSTTGGANNNEEDSLKLKKDDEEKPEDQVMQSRDFNRKIGVREFFIAQKAAKKLREFAKNYYVRLAKQEKEIRERKERGELEDDNESEQEKASSKSLFSKPKVHGKPEQIKNAKIGSEKSSSKGTSQKPSLNGKGQLFSSSKLTKNLKKLNKSAKSVTPFETKKSQHEQQSDGLSNVLDSESIKTITEEDLSGEEKVTNKSVKDFLQKLEDLPVDVHISELEDSHQDVSLEESKDQRLCTRDQATSVMPSSTRQSVNLIMAFNDLRRANASVRDLQNVKIRPQSKKRETSQQLLAKGQQRMMEISLLQKKLKQDLDFDKLISQRPKNISLQLPYGDPQNNIIAIDTALAQSTHQTRIQVFDDQNQYDLSFIQRSEAEAGYHSDKDYIKQDYKRRKSIIESSERVSSKKSEQILPSVISSDSSIKSQIGKYKLQKEVRERKQARRMKQNTRSGNNLNRDNSQTLKRMLTGDFTNERTKLKGGEDNTTLYGSQSFKQQIETYSNLNKKSKKRARLGPNSSRSPSISQTQSDLSHRSAVSRKAKHYTKKMINRMKIAQQKMQRVGQYDDFNKQLFSENCNDPYSMFDRKKQKITINPGVPYVSTSQNDIFELRIQKNQKESTKKFVKTMEALQDDSDVQEQPPIYVDSVESDEVYITSPYSPYQLKNKLRMQKVEEMQFDANDEDTFIMQQQPFETVMNIGYENFLNHLNTKFIARRSDIIVSSTLSFTMSPQDNFQPTKFIELNRPQITDWVDLRSEFRSQNIESCKLNPSSNKDAIQNNLMESDESDDDRSVHIGTSIEQSYLISSAGNERLESMGQSKRQIEMQQKRLPKTLLSQPLRPDQVLLLNEQDKRSYNIQRTKFEVEVRKISRQEFDIATTNFDMKTAKDLINGNYWQEELEDEKMNTMNSNLANTEHQPNKQVFLGREGLMGELRLDQFEKAVKKIISNDQQQHKDQLLELLGTDNVPDEIKAEFGLPSNMKQNEVNFTEVRMNDATIAIKHLIWSGQEVLSTSLNMEQSEWIVSKISGVRVWPKGYMNIVKKIRSLLKMFAMHPLFEHFMTLCVIINTVVMSMDSYGIEESTDLFLTQMNEIFTYIFIFEMGIKLLAIGPKKYSASKWNLLDGGVVLLSIIELVIESQSEQGKGGSSISAFRTVKVFRTFRVMRVARILRALRSMQVIIGVITRSFRSFMYVILLLFVFVFIYALLGIQIYQGNYDFGPDERLPRENFEEFGIAFVTVFQVLTMENWQTVMYESMRSAGGSVIMKTLTAIYYVSWIFIGNFILLNLFLAILIDSFNTEEDDTKATVEEEIEAEKKSQVIKQQRIQEMKLKRRKKLGSSTSSKFQPMGTVQMEKKKIITFTGTNKDEADQIEDLDELDSEAIRAMLISNNVVQVKETKREPIIIPQSIQCTSSIYIFHRNDCFRKTFFFVQQHRYFDRFIMALIAISSLQLAFETYIMTRPDDDPMIVANVILGDVITYSFVVEFLFKLVALGFVMESGSYLRDSWNQLDFFILCISLIDKSLASSDIEALKILRMLRILRPLRVVSHNVQLKMIVIALMDAAGSIVNVIIVVLVVWLMFAIFAVSTYKGTFFYCSIDKYDYQDKYECIDKGGEWLRYDSNFDNIGQAMMTLFVVSSLEGWPEIMHQALDITRVDYGPEYQSNIKQSIFFIVFILIGSFFFLNFFIGVLFLKYSEAQKREVAGFTDEQLMWKEMQAMILKAQCPHNMVHKPNSSKKWRLKVWQLVTSQTFEVGIIVIIVLNMLQMAMTHEGASKTVEQFMDITNLIFTSCFICEAILKLFAFGWSYFGTSWNKFDFFVVVASIMDIFLTIYQDLSANENQGDADRQQSALSAAPQLARVLRVLRVSRLLRIAGHYKGLQSLFNTIMLSVSALFNVFMLLMLFFFMLAILGQFMFKGVKEGIVMNEYKNFTVFDRSFLLLFSISTGEDWNRIMYDCSHVKPDCIEGENCGSSFAAAYFIAFILLVTYVMLNLFILVIIQQFQKLYLDSEGPLQLFNRDFEIIILFWVKFTERQHCVKLKDKFIFEYMKSIPPPLGFADKNDIELQKNVLKMNIKSEDGWIYFNELLYRILRNQYGKFTLNKNMQIRELITQYKLFNLTMKQIKKESKVKINMQEKFFRKVGAGGSDTVNPFLTFMYYRISFQAWRQFLIKHQKRQEVIRKHTERNEQRKVFGLDAIDLNEDNMPSEEGVVLYEVDIDVEHFSEWSITSDEDNSKDPATIALDKAKANFPDRSQPHGNCDKHVSSPGLSQKAHRRIGKKRQTLKAFKFDASLAKSQMVQAAEMHKLNANQYLSPETNRLVSRMYQSTGSLHQLRLHRMTNTDGPNEEIKENQVGLEVDSVSCSIHIEAQNNIMLRSKTMSVHNETKGNIVVKKLNKLIDE